LHERESIGDQVPATDDFTIILDESGNMESCGVEVFEELGQLWKLVQRYGVKTPLTINVVDSQPICIRTLKAARDKTGTWQLTDATPTSATCEGKSLTFPLTINSKDRSGNILEVRMQLAPKHNSSEQLRSGTLKVGA
jgi:hypothetical protein